MSIKAYQSLIDQICEHAQIPDPQSMYLTAELEVKGSKFLLRHGGSEAEQTVLIYCAMGELLTQSREVVLLRLMETNLYLFGTAHNPFFVYNPENKHVMLTCTLWLGEASGLKTLALLEHFSEIAAEWRQNYFLEKKENQSGMLSAGRSASKSDRARSNVLFGASLVRP